MRIITEIELRDLYKKEPFTSFVLRHPDRLTPAATQFLSERRISVTNGNKQEGLEKASKELTEGYLVVATGEILKEKPEHLTHLKGKSLVVKNHPRIKFRGKVDSIEAFIAGMLVETEETKDTELFDALRSILIYLQKLLTAEVKEEFIPVIDYMGWNEADLREYSHHPGQNLGYNHVFPMTIRNKSVALLNKLRTEVRELEVFAMDAFFCAEKGVLDRQDIILGLNRLSSLVYILMCKQAAKQNT